MRITSASHASTGKALVLTTSWLERLRRIALLALTTLSLGSCALFEELVPALHELSQSMVKVMSFNIQHDREGFWTVELVVGESTFSVRKTGTPPNNFTAAASKTFVTTDADNNMHFFFLSARANRVLTIIQNEAPDVLGLQEAFYDQVRFLAGAMNYRYYARGRDDDHTEGETNGILWNPQTVTAEVVGRMWGMDLLDVGTFWYSNDPSEPGSKGGSSWGSPDLPRIASWVRLKTNKTGRTFYVFNTHLTSNGTADNPQLHRMRSVVLLADKIQARSKPTAPAIVTGDFNSSPNSDPIDFMRGSASFGGITFTNPQPMVDTFRDRNPDSAMGTICSGGGPSGSRIDYIFMWPTMLADSATIITSLPGSVCPSDHMPIKAVIGVSSS